jgi:hypothetical protein
MKTTRKIDANTLGQYMDGWADLIEGMGHSVDYVRQAVINQLIARNMPNIKIESVEIKASIFSSERREYIITTTSPGVTSAISIAKHGNDLFTSWRTYIRPTLNLKLICIYALISVTLAFVLLFLSFIIGVSNAFAYLNNTESWSFLTTALQNVLIIGIDILAVGLILYLILRGLFIRIRETPFFRGLWILAGISLALSFIFNAPGRMLAAVGDVIQIFNAVLSESFISPWMLIFSGTVTTFVGIIVFVMVAGMIFKRDFLAFVLNSPSLFDHDNITAMTLSVHKSLLRALDQTGIASSTLRIKQEFKSGRRGETV